MDPTTWHKGSRTRCICVEQELLNKLKNNSKIHLNICQNSDQNQYKFCQNTSVLEY